MIRLFTDMDNTLIYSYKRNIGNDKLCVEYKGGKQLSYIDRVVYERLQGVVKSDGVDFIPVTTRSIKQFKRIECYLGKYALVANGGILLEDGVVNRDWYLQSLEYVNSCQDLFYDVRCALHAMPYTIKNCLSVDDLFVVLKCSQASELMSSLRDFVDVDLLTICNHNDKVYIIPKMLSKGEAIRRFNERFGKVSTVSAGDSLLDSSMCDYSDVFVTSSKEIDSNDCRVVRCNNVMFFNSVIDEIAV